ncbi:autotransporter outer membrane beta-barrel domain-containing protein [Dyella amyloliquefaciens]|uniref:autotransporter outer membrane beta-barrel domain-containing protein n=1 Tax=Dyella amyloliquefaciens TaxID=1770545 RepID=UPI00102EA972|nr:autotransporter outer membrane beta-barrel domain-containing protein [Dyella amyloliquefaciens]
MSPSIVRPSIRRASLTLAISACLGITGYAHAASPAVIYQDNLSGSANYGVPGNNVLVFGTDNTDTSFAGVINNAGSASDSNANQGAVVKTGTGTVTIDGATFNGGSTYVTGGGFAVTSGTASIDYLGLGELGNGLPGSTDSGTLKVSGGTLSLGQLQVGDFGGTGTVTQSAGQVVFNGGSGAQSLNIGNQGGNGTYNLSGGSVTFGSGQSDFVVLGRTSGNYEFGSGTLNLSGGSFILNSGSMFLGSNAVSTWGEGGNEGSGTINQTGGTLTVFNSAQLYLAAVGSGTYNLYGGTLQIGGSSLHGSYNSYPASYAFNLGGGTIQVTGSALNADVDATLVDGTTSNIDTNGIGATWSGTLSGGGGLNKMGGGVLTLTGANTYAGGTTVTGGMLQVGADANLGAATGAITLNGGALENTASITTSRAMTIGINDGVVLTDDGTTWATSAAVTGAGELIKVGNGTLVLAGGSSLDQGTLVAGGTLVLQGGTHASQSAPVVTLRGTDPVALSVDGATLTSGAGALLAADNAAAATLTVSNTSLSAAGQDLFDARNGSQVSLVADNAQLAGNIVFADSSQGSISLTHGSRLSGRIDPADIAIDAGSSWNMTGSSQVNTLTLAGNVAFAAQAGAFAPKTLTVQSLVGQGGTVTLNEVLSNGATAGDVLAVNGGSVSGHTNLGINNVGGLGAATTGNGILVVQSLNGADTTAQGSKDGFALAGPVRAGAFDYHLQAGDSSGQGQNWYLTSTAPAQPVAPSDPVAPVAPVAPSEPAAAVAPMPPTEPLVAVTPAYRPETSRLPATMSMMNQMTSLALATRHDREGDVPATSDGNPSPWARMIVSNVADSSAGNLSAAYSGSITGVQVGTPVWHATARDGSSLEVGVFGSALDGRGDAQGTVDGVQNAAAGALKTRAYTLDAYVTWQGAHGAYVNGLLQGARLQDRTSVIDGRVNGTSLTAAVEVGDVFAVNDHFSIAPLAQVSYQYGHFDGTALPEGTQVDFDHASGASAKLGARASWDLTGANHALVKPFVELYLVHQAATDFTASYLTPVSRTSLDSQFGSNSVEVGAGLTAQLSDRWSLYSKLDYARYVPGGASGGHVATVEAGARLSF